MTKLDQTVQADLTAVAAAALTVVAAVVAAVAAVAVGVIVVLVVVMAVVVVVRAIVVAVVVVVVVVLLVVVAIEAVIFADKTTDGRMSCQFEKAMAAHADDALFRRKDGSYRHKQIIVSQLVSMAFGPYLCPVTACVLSFLIEVVASYIS